MEGKEDYSYFSYFNPLTYLNMFKNFFVDKIIGYTKGLLDFSSWANKIIDFIFSNILPFFRYTIVEIVGIDDIKKKIKIDYNRLIPIKKFLLDLKKCIPHIKRDNKLLLICTFIYFLSILGFLINPINLIMPSTTNRFLIFLNIVLLLCFLFYLGSDTLFEYFFDEKNLVFSLIYIISTTIAIFMPKTKIISFLINPVLLASNIFMLSLE